MGSLEQLAEPDHRLLQFRRRGYEMIDWVCDYHSRVGDLPVRSQVTECT